MSVWKHGRLQMCIIWQHEEQNNDFQFSKLSVSLFTSVLNGANHLSPRGYCTVFEQNTEKWLDAVIETIFRTLTILSEFLDFFLKTLTLNRLFGLFQRRGCDCDWSLRLVHSKCSVCICTHWSSSRKAKHQHWQHQKLTYSLSYHWWRLLVDGQHLDWIGLSGHGL